jgi:hypothetical protein
MGPCLSRIKSSGLTTRDDASLGSGFWRGGSPLLWGAGEGGEGLLSWSTPNRAFFAKDTHGREPAVQPAIQARHENRREMTYAATAKTSDPIYKRGALRPRGRARTRATASTKRRAAHPHEPDLQFHHHELELFWSTTVRAQPPKIDGELTGGG